MHNVGFSPRPRLRGKSSLYDLIKSSASIPRSESPYVAAATLDEDQLELVATDLHQQPSSSYANETQASTPSSPSAPSSLHHLNPIQDHIHNKKMAPVRQKSALDAGPITNTSNPEG
jgi:hypothetical protein